MTECPVGQPSLNEAFGPAREVQPVSNVEHSLGFIQQWLDTCNESHQGCIRPSSYLPDRVISLKGDSPVVIDTKGVMSEKYITVSHRWGTAFEKKPLMTTKESMDKHKQGIPWEDFPALFQDFLAIAEGLGISYVWIDCLCIVQDDAADWKRQASKMAEIYTNGYLNLAASTAQDSSQSLYFTRGHPDRKYTSASGPVTRKALSAQTLSGKPAMGLKDRCVKIRTAHLSDHQYVQGYSINGLETQNPLLKRAWVFQEQMLSRRTVHFGASEMIWDCRTGRACECYCLDLLSIHASEARKNSVDFDAAPLGSAKTANEHRFLFWTRKQQLGRVFNARSGLNMRQVLDLWLDTVQIYAFLHLTFEKDRSYALAGVAHLFSSRLKSRYFYGIWTEDAARSLAWSAALPSTSGSFRQSDVPTWSWMSRCFSAGHNSWLSFRYSGEGSEFIADSRFEANFKEPHAESASHGTFIPNATCELEVRSAWFQVSVPVEYELEKEHVHVVCPLLAVSSSGLKLALYFIPDWIDGPFGLKSEGMEADMLKALVLGRIAFKPSPDYNPVMLIVRKDSTHHRDFDTFERVGYARFNVMGTEPQQAWDFIHGAMVDTFRLR